MLDGVGQQLQGAAASFSDDWATVEAIWESPFKTDPESLMMPVHQLKKKD